MTVNLLFWNTNRKPLSAEICALVDAHNLDVIILAEYYPDENKPNYAPSLCAALNAARNPATEDFQVAAIEFRRGPVVLSRLGNKLSGKTIHLRTGVYHLFTQPGAPPLLIATLHLPSKLHRTEQRQAIEVREHMDLLLGELDKLSRDLRTTRHLFVGDFNLNPFDPELVDRDRLNSFPCVTLSEPRTRLSPRDGKKLEVRGRYNPSWSLFGDSTSPPGTYYYRDNGQEWHVYDQIVFSRDAATLFVPNSLRVITACGPHNFLKNGIPNSDAYSDHLPLIFSISF